MLFGGIAKWMSVDRKYTPKVVSFLAMTLILFTFWKENLSHKID